MRAVRILKSSETVNATNVAARAASYTHATPGIIKKFIDNLDIKERIALGFPDPNAEPAKSGITFKPDLGSRDRWQRPTRPVWFIKKDT